MRHPKCDLQNGRRRPFCQKFKKIIKIRMALKWPEMPSKVIFGNPKWPPKKTNKILYRSEMARIAIESEFQTSKMADRSEMARKAIKSDFPPAAILQKLKKNLKFRIDLKWPEMRLKVNFGHPKWPTAAIL